MLEVMKRKSGVIVSTKLIDVQYLKQGDLKKIAKEMKMNDRSVYRIYQGKASSERVEMVINELAKKRKIELLAIAPRIE